MKFYVIFGLIAVSFSTFSGTEAVITDQILEEIEAISQTIKNLGMDPMHIKKEAASYALPVPVIFNAAGYLEEVLSTGLSDIIVNDIRYDVIGFRLTFDIELPHIHLSVESIAGEAVIFDNKLFADGSGSIDIYRLRVKGDVRIGVLGGIGARAVDIDSSISGIDSNVKLNIQGLELSDLVNHLLGVTVIDTHAAFKFEIDELIGILLLDYINDNILN